MANLKIINTVEMDALGTTVFGKQGTTTDAKTAAFSVSVTGTVHEMIGTLATATVITLWDDDVNFPNTFNNLHFWADQDCYLQLITTSVSASCVIKIIAKQPFTLSHESIVPINNTTLITGGTEPTADTMDSIILGNYSTIALSYHLILID